MSPPRPTPSWAFSPTRPNERRTGRGRPSTRLSTSSRRARRESRRWKPPALSPFARHWPDGCHRKVWGALTSMIKLEDKVDRQAEAMKSQQSKIEDLTGRVIRLEAQLELLTSAALTRRLGAERG